MKTIFSANLIITIFLLCLPTMGQSQVNHFYYNYLENENKVEFGVKAGVNISRFHGLDNEAKTKAGFVGGLTLDINFSKDFYLLTGFDFLNKGTKVNLRMNYEGMNLLFEKTTIDAMYLHMPVHAGYKIWINDKTKLSLHGGPYIAYGIGGQLKLSDNVIKTLNDGTTITESMNDFVNIVKGFKRSWDTFGEKTPNGVHMDMYKRFDWGLGAGASLQYDKTVLSVNYDFGLTNISRGAGNVKNRVGYITLGYKFN